MASFIVKELPIYPADELQAALNAVQNANPTAVLVQAFENKAGTGSTGRAQVTKKVMTGGNAAKVGAATMATIVRTTAIFIFRIP